MSGGWRFKVRGGVGKTSNPKDLNPNQEPEKHPNINFRVGYPYLIGFIKEGILAYGSFRKLGVPCFGVLIIRILLFRVLY